MKTIQLRTILIICAIFVVILIIVGIIIMKAPTKKEHLNSDIDQSIEQNTQLGLDPKDLQDIDELRKLDYSIMKPQELNTYLSDWFQNHPNVIPNEGNPDTYIEIGDWVIEDLDYAITEDDYVINPRVKPVDASKFDLNKYQRELEEAILMSSLKDKYTGISDIKVSNLHNTNDGISFNLTIQDVTVEVTCNDFKSFTIWTI